MRYGGDKREARRFEPPPWERARFEELEKRRREEAREAERQRVEQEQGPERTSEPPELTQEELAALAAAKATVASREKRQPKASESDNDPPLPVPQAHVDLMLMQLAAEEPSVEEHVKPIGLFAAGIMMVIGVSMSAWGVYGMVRAQGQPMGLIGTSVVLMLGVATAAAAAWLGWRVTNRRGD
jgi:hypothetical protein